MKYSDKAANWCCVPVVVMAYIIRQAPLAVGCGGHRDERHRVGQRVQDRVMRTFFQHGREDHLFVALSTTRNRKKADQCMCGRVLVVSAERMQN